MNEEDLIANLDIYIKELLEVNKDINKQLQAYKDREDRLIDTLLTEIRWQNGIGEVLVEKKLRELLQILNKEKDND